MAVGKTLGNIFSSSSSSVSGTPLTPPAPISSSSVEYSAAQTQQKARGRAANILSGPSGSLVQTNQVTSASKQLLGS